MDRNLSCRCRSGPIIPAFAGAHHRLGLAFIHCLLKRCGSHWRGKFRQGETPRFFLGNSEKTIKNPGLGKPGWSWWRKIHVTNLRFQRSAKNISERYLTKEVLTTNLYKLVWIRLMLRTSPTPKQPYFRYLVASIFGWSGSDKNWVLERAEGLFWDLQGTITHPNLEKGTSSSKVNFWWDMLAPRRVSKNRYSTMGPPRNCWIRGLIPIVTAIYPPRRGKGKQRIHGNGDW